MGKWPRCRIRAALRFLRGGGCTESQSRDSGFEGGLVSFLAGITLDLGSAADSVVFPNGFSSPGISIAFKEASSLIRFSLGDFFRGLSVSANLESPLTRMT